jgi:fucose permease
MSVGVGAAATVVRGPVTWYAYLLMGLFTYLLNIQGNIVPFLKAELDLSYAAVSLHSAAIACGMIVVGLVGRHVVAWTGRRAALALGAMGSAVGAVALCFAPAAWASIASCAAIGVFGAVIPSIVPALLAERHREQRDVAFAEAGAVCYAFAITAALAAGVCIAFGFGWRSAVLLGAMLTFAVLLAFRRTAIGTPSPGAPEEQSQRLPGAYWACWLLMGIGVAIEFGTLVWAPEFLGRVVGLEPATAALGTAVFSLAMLIGRTAISALVRLVATVRLYFTALLLILVGFALYWHAGDTLSAMTALFLLGLGVAPLYPLTAGFAIAAAGTQATAGSSRLMLAVGLSILIMPVLLGSLADAFGLRGAHLLLPLLIASAFLTLGAARILQRREPAATRRAPACG